MLNTHKMILKSGLVATMMTSLLLPNLVSASALSLTDEQHQSLGLQVVEAQKISHFPSVSFSAQAIFHPRTTRTLSSPLSGKISRLNVIHGAVHKGQVIVEIESPELLGLQSQLLASVSDLNVVKNELKRVKKLRQSGVASAKALQQAQADMDKLQAEKDQHVKALKLIGFPKKAVNKLIASRSIQSSTLKIISPIEGQIFDLQVRLGERVSGNQALFSLGETNPMLLSVRVPVALANRLKKGDMAQVTSLGLAEIEHIDPEVDSVTQTVDIHVQVDNESNRVRPGQRFQVHFLITSEQGGGENLYQVPANAISQFKGETVVFVKVGSDIQSQAITVMNMANNQLYFSLKQPNQSLSSDALKVFIKGSTAIKSAFEASEESDA